jgi:hypothetical protein
MAAVTVTNDPVDKLASDVPCSVTAAAAGEAAAAVMSPVAPEGPFVLSISPRALSGSCSPGTAAPKLSGRPATAADNPYAAAAAGDFQTLFVRSRSSLTAAAAAAGLARRRFDFSCCCWRTMATTVGLNPLSPGAAEVATAVHAGVLFVPELKAKIGKLLLLLRGFVCKLWKERV